MSRDHEGQTRGATVAWTVALLLWVAFIWGNSLTPGDESGQLSGFFVGLARPLFELLGLTDESVQTLVIRKGAHFTEYLVLGVIAAHALGGLVGGGRRSWPLAALVCACVPCVDETIQLFVPGRVGAVGDVCIDLAGCAVGLLLCLLAAHGRR